MNAWPDLLILGAAWLIILVALCIGLVCASAGLDPFDGPAWGCSECGGFFPSLRSYELHECVREARGEVRRAS